MSNLLKAEFYKLFHSWYFWGIGLFNLLLSSVLLLDSVGETSNLFFASIYNMPILYFLTIIFSALFVGNDFGRRTLQSYINAGHRRGKILFAKLVIANTPLGVWLFRYENKRPLPEIDKSLQDVNRIKKYVFTWLGHICKMCGVKNGYTRLYEDEINRLRVEKPEYEDEDDESLLIDAYSESQDGDE